ncbi:MULTISPECIES: hypothetical protein [unclassified Streptomyces]|uniref:hypothetical protein n=1 Tax=unclassified Streptomyces TaxID=2593676 RepID=UPI00073AFFF4|nr:hypothetical protein [Streptomyces sp. AVP053U2]ODA69847.1 hypothetical protein APS67_005966 [Streptomyces sp. AVP053U2]
MRSPSEDRKPRSVPPGWSRRTHGRGRLDPGGVLVFSRTPAVEGCHGARGVCGNGCTGKVLPVQRWACSEKMWLGFLMNHGFREADARVLEVLEALDPENLGTLIVQVRAR